ncbi:MAG TPA: LuxR C-terminal-related transcriptional regulator, partial [Rudaea sp.]
AALWWGGCDALQTPHPLAPLHDIARSCDTTFRALLGAEVDRAVLFEAVLTQMHEQAHGTLLVIEDAHWADEATLDLLKFLGRRIERTRSLLVVSYRDDEVDAAHPLRRLIGGLPSAQITRIDVPRLSPAGVAALARNALRSPEGLHAATQGNPFFVTEMLRQSSDGVPRGVQDLVLARYARLGAAAQAIVRLASIVPARIERWLVDRLLAPDLAAVEECLNSGLLIGAATTFAFRHELARVAIEASLSAPAARALHAQVLQTLESEAAGSVSLARRVHHAAHAGDADAVLRLAPAAAEQARRRGAHKEAAAHLRTALDHAQALPDAQKALLFEQRSYECYLTDQGAEAIAAREASLRCWRAVGDARKEGDALRWLSRLSWYNGRTAAAEDYAAQAIAVLETLPPCAERAMAYSNRAQLHMLAGASAPAQEWGRRALELAVALGDREIEIHALNNIGTAMMDEGNEAGRAELERSLDLALAHGYEEHAARAFTNLSYTAVLVHDRAHAQDYLSRGIAYCEEHDLDAWARYMAAYRSELWLAHGEWDRAETQAQEIARSPLVAPISRIMALVVLGRLRVRRGDPQAQPVLDEALALALPTGAYIRIGPVAAARAEAAWLRGDTLAVVREARLAPTSSSSGAFLTWIGGELSYWLHRAGALDAAPVRCAEPFALQIAGRWREAAAAWEQRGCPYEQARALAEGDIEAQRDALVRFERLGAQPDAERVRKQLHAAGVRGLPRGQRASTQANPHDLTTREIQVLRLLCAGMKNAQIAERLSRSVRTVDHHLEAIFAKLGVTSRTEAMAAALAAGIDPEK